MMYAIEISISGLWR